MDTIIQAVRVVYRYWASNFDACKGKETHQRQGEMAAIIWGYA